MSRPHILYIDNDFESKKKAVIALYSADLEVLPVSNLREALVTLRNIRTDLIICDMHLADGDATHLIQTLKTSKAFQNIPIIVVSSAEDEDDQNHVLQLGAQAHMLKDDESYVETVKELIIQYGDSYRETSSGISGQLASLTIVDLLRQVAKDNHSGMLTIDGSVAMEVHFRDGKIVHARHGITIGKKALFRCLRVAEAAYHFRAGNDPIEASIKGDLETILEEGKLSNEKLMANYYKLPNSNYRVRVTLNESEKTVQLKAEARAALEIFKKNPRIGAYLDRFNLPDILCYEYLVALLDRNYIELVTEKKPVRVVTDTSCELPLTWLLEHNVTTLPIRLQCGNDIYVDRAHSEDLYRQKIKVLARATTLAPEEEHINQTYRALLPDYDCLSILSGGTPIFEAVQNTVNKIMETGLDGKRLLANELVTLNSHCCSLGLGLLVREAAAMAAAGEQIEFIEERILQAIANMRIIFSVVPENSILVKKGNAPVILTWAQDQFHITHRMNKGETPAPVLTREVKSRLDHRAKLHIALGHVEAQAVAKTAKKEMQQQLGLSKLDVLPLGPVNGHLLGADAVGVAFFQE